MSHFLVFCLFQAETVILFFRVFLHPFQTCVWIPCSDPSLIPCSLDLPQIAHLALPTSLRALTSLLVSIVFDIDRVLLWWLVCFSCTIAISPTKLSISSKQEPQHPFNLLKNPKILTEHLVLSRFQKKKKISAEKQVFNSAWKTS